MALNTIALTLTRTSKKYISSKFYIVLFGKLYFSDIYYARMIYGRYCCYMVKQIDGAIVMYGKIHANRRKR